MDRDKELRMPALPVTHLLLFMQEITLEVNLSNYLMLQQIIIISPLILLATETSQAGTHLRFLWVMIQMG